MCSDNIESMDYCALHLQIDNAVRIVDSGAMALIIKDLNHTSNEVKAASAFVIGSAAQR